MGHSKLGWELNWEPNNNKLEEVKNPGSQAFLVGNIQWPS